MLVISANYCSRVVGSRMVIEYGNGRTRILIDLNDLSRKRWEKSWLLGLVKEPHTTHCSVFKERTHKSLPYHNSYTLPLFVCYIRDDAIYGGKVTLTISAKRGWIGKVIKLTFIESEAIASWLIYNDIFRHNSTRF
jgi:hypothetical protein